MLCLCIEMICFHKPRFHTQVMSCLMKWKRSKTKILLYICICWQSSQFTRASVNVTLRLLERYGSRSQGSWIFSYSYTVRNKTLINLNWSFLRPAHYLTPQIQFTVNFYKWWSHRKYKYSRCRCWWMQLCLMWPITTTSSPDVLWCSAGHYAGIMRDPHTWGMVSHRPTRVTVLLECKFRKFSE